MIQRAIVLGCLACVVGCGSSPTSPDPVNVYAAIWSFTLTHVETNKTSTLTCAGSMTMEAAGPMIASLAAGDCAAGPLTLEHGALTPDGAVAFDAAGITVSGCALPSRRFAGQMTGSRFEAASAVGTTACSTGPMFVVASVHGTR